VTNPRRFDGGDEELRPVGVGSSVCHREKAGGGVPEFEILIWQILCLSEKDRSGFFFRNSERGDTFKFVAINGFSSCTIVVCEVASLEHELREEKRSECRS
jgi:hypothetical protein